MTRAGSRWPRCCCCAGGGAAERRAPRRAGRTALAIFAGGCFWCMEPPFDAARRRALHHLGLHRRQQSRTPATSRCPRGGTGHVEAVQVDYDPARVSYEQLLDVFWHNVDPLDDGGQFCDRGAQYRSATLRARREQRKRPRSRSARSPSASASPPATTIRDAAPFYDAEAYHQDYYRKNPIRYRFYRSRCGRDGRLEELWGPSPSHP